MNRLIIHAGVWSALVLLAVADLAWLYPRLPERVATHFNAAGAADGWSTRAAFLWTWVGTFGVVLLLGTAVAWLVRVIPPQFINVPRREFWLAPARLAWTRQAISDLVSAKCGVLFLALLALNHLTMRANLKPDPQLGSGPWVILGLTLAGVVTLISLSVWRFRRAA